jgi:hypothetical protein
MKSVMYSALDTLRLYAQWLLSLSKPNGRPVIWSSYFKFRFFDSIPLALSREEKGLLRQPPKGKGTDATKFER